MSLFRATEYWSTQVAGDEQFASTALCVGRLLANQARDLVAVGSLQGGVSVFDPGAGATDGGTQPFKPEHVLVETRLGAPVLQVAAARLVTGATHDQLAILQPRTLAVYAVQESQSAQVEHGTQYVLHNLYQHSLQRTAYNLICGQFGGVSGKDYICVQSIDGTLSFFEQENFAFSRFLPGALLPGPFAFVPMSDSFVTVSSSYQLESYKYQVLAVAAESNSKDEAASMTTGKRVSPDWIFPMGEAALDVAVLEISPAQPSILVLGERSIFCLTEGGTMRFLKKLDYSPVCFLAYSATSEGYLQYLVGTTTQTVVVYGDTCVKWTAQLSFAPIAVLRAQTTRDLRGVLVALGDGGRLACAFLGTDPALFGLPQTEARRFDVAERQKELRRLQALIRGNQTGITVKARNVGNDLTIQCSSPVHVDDKSSALDTTLGDASVPSATVRVRWLCLSDTITGRLRQVTLAAKSPLENVQLFVAAAKPIVAHQQAFSFPNLIGAQEVPITFYLRNSLVPTDLDVKMRATFGGKGSPSRTVETSCRLPLSLICVACAPTKTAAHKITLESNVPTVGLDQIYSEFTLDSAGGDAAATSLGIQLMNSAANPPVVSLLVSQNAQKYRVQSDSFDALWIVLCDFLPRIYRHFASSSDVRLSFSGNFPLAEYFALVDHHLELQKRRQKLAEMLSGRCVQLRAVQRHLLTKFKDTTPTPLAHLDGLLEMTHRQACWRRSCDERRRRLQIFNVAAAVQDVDALLEAKGASLSAATRLLLCLARCRAPVAADDLDTIRSAFTPIVDEYPDLQTWQERVDASVTHLLHVIAKGHPAASPTNQQLPKLTDSGRFKKHVALLFDRLAKGVHIHADADAHAAPVKAAKPRPVVRTIGSKLEPIAEDTNATDLSDTTLGDAQVPLGSKFGSILSGNLSQGQDNKADENDADSEFQANVQTASYRQPLVEEDEESVAAPTVNEQKLTDSTSIPFPSDVSLKKDEKPALDSNSNALINGY